MVHVIQRCTQLIHIGDLGITSCNSQHLHNTYISRENPLDVIWAPFQIRKDDFGYSVTFASSRRRKDTYLGDSHCVLQPFGVHGSLCPCNPMTFTFAHIRFLGPVLMERIWSAWNSNLSRHGFFRWEATLAVCPVPVHCLLPWSTLLGQSSHEWNTSIPVLRNSVFFEIDFPWLGMQTGSRVPRFWCVCCTTSRDVPVYPLAVLAWNSRTHHSTVFRRGGSWLVKY